jgi:hypothetical protein
VSISETWEALEREGGAAGRVVRRIYPESPFNLYLGIDLGSGRRQLIFERAWSPLDRFPELPVTKAIACSAETREGGSRLEIVIELTDEALSDVFSPVVEDVAKVAAASPDEPTATAYLIGELSRWVELFRQLSAGGLEVAARRGIAGELIVLLEHILPARAPEEAVAGWTGPMRANQDFQFTGLALEVKVTTSKQPQGFVVANERELDATGVGQLWLTHLSLDERRGGVGRNLNDIVGEVQDELDGHPFAAENFATKLTRSGYLESHRAMYEEPHYEVRSERFFLVVDGFPRLTEADIPAGVGDVKYSVALASCEPYSATADTFRTRLADEGWK